MNPHQPYPNYQMNTQQNAQLNYCYPSYYNPLPFVPYPFYQNVPKQMTEEEKQKEKEEIEKQIEARKQKYSKYIPKYKIDDSEDKIKLSYSEVPGKVRNVVSKPKPKVSVFLDESQYPPSKPIKNPVIQPRTEYKSVVPHKRETQMNYSERRNEHKINADVFRNEKKPKQIEEVERPKKEDKYPPKKNKIQPKMPIIDDDDDDLLLFEDVPNKRDEFGNLIGTSEAMEKHYYRIKGEARSCDVRPLHVLQKSLDYVMNQYKINNDYDYICEQLKCIRQDLTLQHIENEFNIKVYEIHSKISLSNGDISEFIQCASQLKILYRKFNYDENDENVIFHNLSLLLCSMDSKSAQPATSYSLMLEIPQHLMNNEHVKFVLKVKKAFEMKDYPTYFKLYRNALEPYKSVLKVTIDKTRFKAICSLLSSTKPVIFVGGLKTLFSFESDEEFNKFVSKNNIILNENGDIDCDASLEAIRKLS